MRNICHFDVGPNLIKDISEGILEKNQDSVLVIPAIANITTWAPNRRRKCHKLVFEVLVPEEGIIGYEAINDFGGFVTIRLPKKRIKAELLKGDHNHG